MIRRLRFMQVEPDIPDIFKLTPIKVRSPLLPDQIQRLVANLTVNSPKFTSPQMRPGPVAASEASQLEEIANGIFVKVQQDRGKRLFYKWVDSAVETGEGIYKVTLRLDHWSKMPVRDADESADKYLSRVDEYKMVSKLPVRWDVIDRRTFYPVYDDDGLARCFEVTERPIYSIREEFEQADFVWGSIGAAVGGVDNASQSLYSSMSGHRKVKLIEYWDRQYVVWMVCHNLNADWQYGQAGGAGAVLAWRRHGYGRVPYFCGYAEETSSYDPNYEGMSPVFPIMNLVPFMDSLLTAFANVGYLTGFPTMQEVRTGQGTLDPILDDEVDQETRDEGGLEVGSIVRPADGKEYKLIEFGKPAQAITAMIAQTEKMVQSAMLPAVMQGIPPGSRTAGYAIQELAQGAKAKYQNIIANGETALAEAVNFSLWLIEKRVEQDVFVPVTLLDDKTGNSYETYKRVRPSDIDGRYNIRVKIQPRSPVDRQMEGTFAANMVTARLMPRRVAIEEGLGEEHPDAYMDEMLVEEMMEEPDIKEYIKKQAMREAGLGPMMEDLQAMQEVLAAQANAQQMALAGGGSPGPMNPGAPGTGNAAGVQTMGAPAVNAPSAPGMEVPGMPALNVGRQMAQANATPMGPRQYSRPAGRQAGRGSRPPFRPGIAGFQSR